MARKQQNKLAEKSLFANLKNFILNFAIALVWLVKSVSKICWRKITNKENKDTKE